MSFVGYSQRGLLFGQRFVINHKGPRKIAMKSVCLRWSWGVFVFWLRLKRYPFWLTVNIALAFSDVDLKCGVLRNMLHGFVRHAHTQRNRLMYICRHTCKSTHTHTHTHTHTYTHSHTHVHTCTHTCTHCHTHTDTHTHTHTHTHRKRERETQTQTQGD